MTCYHPLKGFIVGKAPNGKNEIKITSYKNNRIEKKSNGMLFAADENMLPSPEAIEVYKEYIEIPCGQCIGCRLDYSKQWANRMMLESQRFEHNYFVTLTYDNDHLVESCTSTFCNEEGEAGTSYSLNKEDWQLFMKRLRKHYSYNDPVTGKTAEASKIRYYMCGEYGTLNHRPHYHAIIFNLKIDDLQLVSKSREGFPLYTSPTISELWGKGIICIAPVSWETCAYTARYCAKKIGKNKDFYEAFNLLPEFSLMSRRPGIGACYYNEHKDDLCRTYIINFSTAEGGKKFTLPRYFKRMLEVDYPEESAQIRENMIFLQQEKQRLKLSKTDIDYLSLLEIEENNFKSKTLSLRKDDI